MPQGLRGDARNDAFTGYVVYLGTIDATITSKTNHEATVPFSNTGEALKGKSLYIQNAGAVSIRLYSVATNTGVVTNTRGAGAAFGPEIQPGERLPWQMTDKFGFVAVIATSGTANVDFFEAIG